MRLFKTAHPTDTFIRKTLSDLEIGPERVDSLVVTDKGDITLVLTATTQTLEADEARRYEIEQVLMALKNVGKVRVILTAHDAPRSPAEAAPKPGTQRVRKGANLSGSAQAQGDVSRQTTGASLDLPGVTSIIAVASAKGGVGKSTISLNLAVAMARKGLRVGLLDADVYGPSIPTMTGTTQVQPEYSEDKKLVPIEAFGLKLMSIGYVSDVDAPMIWRGPIVMSAISQMMRDVDWGDLDVLVIDTPPGTGDAQLTLAQKVALSGAVIVSTPQEVALADVRRGVAMFRKTNVPVLGLVENMAWFEDPVSGNRSYIFGEGGARQMADTLDIPFLGEMPLVSAIRSGGDIGSPVAADGDEATRKRFDDIASLCLENLSRNVPKPAPAIIFE